MAEMAAVTRTAIYRLGGAFMISREAKGFSAELGLDGWAPYFRGRCGVLGDVDADVVTAAAGFFPADVVRDNWTAGSAVPAAAAAERYALVSHAFGRRKLAELPEADAARLAELLETVAGSADVVGAPLFAGWRALPLPAEPRARVIQLAHVLRELRGGLHVLAVKATGLTPLEAVLTHSTALLLPSGEANAEYFGWPRPYPEITDETRERWNRAEALTEDLLEPAFAILGADEAAELVTLLGRADKAVFG